MNTKLIQVSRDRAVEIFAFLLFKPVSPMENKVMRGIINGSDNGCFLLIGESGSDLKKELGLNDSSFNVCISRLIKKGMIRKNKGVVQVNPVFLEAVNEGNQYLMRFVTG